MYRAILLLAIAAIGLPLGIYFVINLPKYEDAIVHGTVMHNYQGADIRPGFARPDAWWLNVSLDRGTNGNMSVWWDQPCNPCYPQKLCLQEASEAEGET